MSRTLFDGPIADRAQQAIDTFHPDVVRDVQAAVGRDQVVVVGMAWNPHVAQARKALDEANIGYTYLEYGSYVSQWKERLAIKMWSGWPTFPQVYVSGTLIGGNARLREMLKDGSLRTLLDADKGEEKDNAAG
ncbi:MAG: glutaredoxin domain-containing protein [Myxococcota bacterium]